MAYDALALSVFYRDTSGLGPLMPQITSATYRTGFTTILLGLLLACAPLAFSQEEEGAAEVIRQEKVHALHPSYANGLAGNVRLLSWFCSASNA